MRVLLLVLDSGARAVRSPPAPGTAHEACRPQDSDAQSPPPPRAPRIPAASFSCRVCVRKVKQALSEDRLLKVDAATRQRARQAGTLEDVYVRQRPISLDLLLDEDDPDSSLLEALQAPSQAATPPRDPHKRAQVDALLSYLSPRAEIILRLRYGLLDDDERPHTTAEIARTLGLSRGTVKTTEHDAMQRLRALVAGEATITKRNRKVCISLPGCRTPRLSAERKHLLTQAYTRLEEAYTQLVAAGKAPSGRALARLAHVAKPMRWNSYVLAASSKPQVMSRLQEEQEQEESSMTNQQIARRQASQQRLLTAPAPSLETVHLSLHDTDPVTGDEDGLCALFYEYYRGYTIYSNEEGVCCIHGAGREGCLRLWGKYVSFPNIEAAKNLIKYFRAQEIRSEESMDRSLPEGDEHVHILNAPSAEPVRRA